MGLGCDSGDDGKVINSIPVCTITEPQLEAEFGVGDIISFAGTATDDDIDNSSLTVSWESDLDGVLDTTAPDTSGALGFEFDGLRVGRTIP